ncbi:hypothetical protein IFM47457_09836 [Aspergillus lentulus]|nr:hypothetical protein IFM47457_09836 [Aspergillus lentulus]
MSIEGGDGLLAWLGRKTEGDQLGSKLGRLPRWVALLGPSMACSSARSDVIVHTAPSELKEKEAEKAVGIDFASFPRAARGGDRLCATQGGIQLAILRQYVCQGRRFYRGRISFAGWGVQAPDIHLNIISAGFAVVAIS